MKHILSIICFVTVSTLVFSLQARAQNSSTIKEFEKIYTTYPFSDADPVPNSGKIYPYFRYDGFTVKPIQKKWKVVELENDFIKVDIMPEIGGKIWTAIDKQTGKPFIYENDVVKFRDIAMRGPWTSGGIEVNFGIIGHTPAVANPIDYLIRQNNDGSVSCIIGTLDLLTRSRWNLEIRLPKDKAYFITKAYWHNTTNVEQPYYSWMNLAVKTSDSLEFIDPGTHYIEHGGKPHPWPFDTLNNKNLSIYNQNNFGDSKSYHIMGTYSKYFGAYWQQDNNGMIHFAEREDKPGKKVFMWALSGEGKIWEDLLTDHNGQYAEIQSGRLFSQNVIQSSYTPFKQVGFQPYQSDTWTEYWYPYKNTNGVKFADLNGVVNIQKKLDSVTVFISSVSDINSDLVLKDNAGKVIVQQKINLKPLQTFQKSFLSANKAITKLELGESTLDLGSDSAKELSRPLLPYPDFDWNSGYGLYLMGRDLARYRDYREAENYIRASIQKEPAFMPSLTEMAFLKYHHLQYDSAFSFAQKALSIDTYDPAANYYYGLSAEKLNKWYDAIDGFEIATLTIPYRSAAYTALSRMHMHKGDYQKAREYALKSFESDGKNMSSLELRYLTDRLLGYDDDKEIVKLKILSLDPLNHFIRFEDYWKLKVIDSQNAFKSLIRNELPEQTYLELAIWYYELNRKEEAKAVLNMAPKNNIIEYWQAFLHKDDNDAPHWLEMANKGNSLMVFPFREETTKIMDWARANTDNWKPSYYLALIQASRNNNAAALNLLNSVNMPVNFAPFYILKSRLYDPSDSSRQQLKELSMAVSIDKNEWRYGKALTELLLSKNEDAEALKIIKPYYLQNKSNYIIGMLYARCLMNNNEYVVAEKTLGNLNILPFEGATDGHRLYKKVKLMLALQLLEKNNYKAALTKVKEARDWPENLGVGKPYPDMIKEDLENDIDKLILNTSKSRKLNNEEINVYKAKIKSLR